MFAMLLNGSTSLTRIAQNFQSPWLVFPRRSLRRMRGTSLRCALDLWPRRTIKSVRIVIIPLFHSDCRSPCSSSRNLYVKPEATVRLTRQKSSVIAIEKISNGKIFQEHKETQESKNSWVESYSREKRRGSIAKCIGARVMRYLLLLLTYDLSPRFACMVSSSELEKRITAM